MLTPKRFICTRSIAWCFFTGAIVFAGQVCADQTYDQTNASLVWDTTTQNWVGPAAWINSTANNAIFTGTPSKFVDVNDVINVGNITFGSSGWNIGDLSAPTGSLNLAAPSTITVTNTGDTDTISAAIASGALTKAGAGTLVLSGTNTFSGAVNVTGTGNLKITSNTALGDTTSGTTVASGASLILGNGVTVTGEALSIAGNGSNSAGALQADNGATATWTGTITLDAAAGGRVGAGSGGTLNLTGLIQGAAAANGLVVGEIPSAASPGTVIISGTGNTYAGSTSIVRGVLQLGATNALPTGTTVNVSSSTSATEDAVFDLHGFNQTVAGITRTNTGGAGIITNNGATPSTLTVADSTSVAFSGIIRDGTSTVALTKSGTTTLTLSGANTYTGATTISAGTLSLTGSLAGTAITVSGGATGGILNESSTGVIGGASSLNVATGSFSGATNLTPGVTLAGVNTFTGAVTVGTTGATPVSGVLYVTNNFGLGNTSGVTVNGASAPASASEVVLGNNVTVTGTTITLNGIGTNSNGALQSAPSSTATWAGNIVAASATRIGGGDSGTLNVNGVISGAQGIAIVFGRANNSTTVLNAVNTYLGDTVIFANAANTNATLKIGVDNAINASSRLSTLGAAMLANSSATLDLNGHILTLRGLDTSLIPSAGHAETAIVANNAAGTTSILTVGDTTGSVTFGGTIKDGTSGAGGMSLVKINAGTQILTGSNTYTGTTTVNAGTLQIGAGSATNTTGTGTLASTSFILNGGTLSLNNAGSGNNNTNRISDTATLSLRGGGFSLVGSDQTSTNSSETVGTFNLDGGVSTITVSAGSTNTAVLTANQLLRSANGTGIAFVNGASLGSSSTAVNRLLLNTAPTLVGTTAPQATGINAAAKNTQIVPYLVGVSGVGTGLVGTAGSVPNTFVTYTATGGLRPLNPTDEFTQNAFTAGNNTRITNTSTTNVTTSVAINALVLDTAAATTLQINTGQTLTITSGAVLFSTGSPSISGPGKLDFGSTEGIMTNVTGNVVAISAPITTTGGISYYGTSNSIFGLSGASTYSSNTWIKSGTVVPQASSSGPAGAPTSGPFGTGTLVFGGASIRSQSSGAITIGNPISFAADTTIPSGGQTLTLTGPVTLTGNRTLTQNSTASTVFSGSIGDGGNAFGLTVTGSASSAPVVLSGTNTYTGPTNVKGSTLVVSGSLSGSTAVLVGDAANPGTFAILGGSGTVGNVTVGASVGNTGAVLYPHASLTTTSPGVTFTANNVTFANSSAHLALEIDRSSAYTGAPGTGAAGGDLSDHLATTGSLTLNGADLQLSLNTSYTPVNGDLFFLTINSGGAINGTFSSLNGIATNLSEGSIFSYNSQSYEITYQANYLSNSFTGGNDIALMAVIPEPSTWMSLFGGLGCLVGAQRFRRSWGTKSKR